jgi:hypothetical protein
MKRPGYISIHVVVPPKLGREIDKHRAELDALLPEGAELTSKSAAVRHLIRAGLDASRRSVEGG